MYIRYNIKQVLTINNIVDKIRINEAELSTNSLNIPKPKSIILGICKIQIIIATKDIPNVIIKHLHIRSLKNNFANNVESYLSSTLLTVCKIRGVANVNIPIRIGIQKYNTTFSILSKK
jgi:hypothetical protein